MKVITTNARPLRTQSGLSCILYLKVPDSIKNKPQIEVPNLNHASGEIDGDTVCMGCKHNERYLSTKRTNTTRCNLLKVNLMFPCWLTYGMPLKVRVKEELYLQTLIYTTTRGNKTICRKIILCTNLVKINYKGNKKILTNV